MLGPQTYAVIWRFAYYATGLPVHCKNIPIPTAYPRLQRRTGVRTLSRQLISLTQVLLQITAAVLDWVRIHGREQGYSWTDTADLFVILNSATAVMSFVLVVAVHSCAGDLIGVLNEVTLQSTQRK